MRSLALLCLLAAAATTTAVADSDAPPSSNELKVTGTLDKNIIRRYIRRNLPKLQFCYEAELKDNPSLAGTVTAKFVIGGDGKVTSSTASGLHPKVDTCVANVIKNIEFPKPKGGGVVQVSYPFAFRSSK